jgi:membrane-bound lytic murein transglycosylase B
LVRQIQAELKKRGYFGSTVDGVFGRTTNGAIMAYQRDNNLSDDGQPSESLLKHLRGG